MTKDEEVKRKCEKNEEEENLQKIRRRRKKEECKEGDKKTTNTIRPILSLYRPHATVVHKNITEQKQVSSS